MAFDHDQYKENILARYEHWTTFLHVNQVYLGRSYIALNREGDLDPYRDTTPAEKYELDVAINGLWVAIKKLYRPDKFDYTNFGNVWKHCHLHVIPRYETARMVNGEEFRDGNWGSNYAPYDREFGPSPQTLEVIRSDIKKELRTT